MIGRRYRVDVIAPVIVAVLVNGNAPVSVTGTVGESTQPPA